MMMKRIITSCLFCLLLSGCCAMTRLADRSELQQSRREFNAGYYKHAIHRLIPIACNGNPEAEYAVGYMYYYGYGVAQDPEMGYFWIERAANQGYAPAALALKILAPCNDR